MTCCIMKSSIDGTIILKLTEYTHSDYGKCYKGWRYNKLEKKLDWFSTTWNPRVFNPIKDIVNLTPKMFNKINYK